MNYFMAASLSAFGVLFASRKPLVHWLALCPRYRYPCPGLDLGMFSTPLPRLAVLRKALLNLFFSKQVITLGLDNICDRMYSCCIAAAYDAWSSNSNLLNYCSCLASTSAMEYRLRLSLWA